MARTKAPIPSIIPLRILMELYIRSKKNLEYQDPNNETKYAEAIGKCLELDGIIGATSKNLINKLRGFPFQAKDAQEYEGIEIEVLHKIAKKVIEYFKLSPQENIDISEVEWGYFQKEVAKIPDHLKHISDAGYYKFLNQEDQNLVDGFVSRTIGFLTESRNVYNYSIYFWNRARRVFRSAIIQINNNVPSATYTLYDFVDNQWNIDSIQRTDIPGGLFKRVNNTLFMNFVEEDNEKAHLRTNLCLSIPASDFFKEQYLNGILSSSAQNGQMPMAAAVIMEKMKSYKDAYNTITNINGIDPKIYFELLNRRIEVWSQKYEKFRSARILPLVESVAGPYLFGFFKRKNDSKHDPVLITKGICFIENNGRVASQINDSSVIFEGYINNNLYYDEDTITIKNFIKDSADDFKYRYNLRIIREGENRKTTNRPVIRLEGIYAGIDGIPRAGAIVFLRLTEDKYKTCRNFDDLKKSGIEFTRIDASSKNLTGLDKELKRTLISNNYSIAPPDDLK